MTGAGTVQFPELCNKLIMTEKLTHFDERGAAGG